MISVTPSPPQPSRTAWTSKPCPPCRGTTMPGSPCAPTPTPRSRSRTRPPRLWAASWDRLYNRVSSSKNRTGRQIFPSGAFLSFPTVSACGSRCGSGFLTRTVKQLFATKKSPKTEVFGDFWSCYPDLNRRPHPYQGCALPTELQQQMATRKGLEPSTSGVTGRRSNQLNYRAISTLYHQRLLFFLWQGQKESNPRHAVLETAALPAELYPYMVGLHGLEPWTGRL